MYKSLCALIIILFTTLSAFTEESYTRYKLPFEDDNARYFFEHEGILFFGNHSERTLYRVDNNNKCMKIEDLKGWYILDACMFNKKIIYCSRQRILYKENKKIKTVPIPGTASLVSITTDGRNLFLLDKHDEGKRFAIVVLDKSYKKIREFQCPGRFPLEIYYHDGFLWIYDQHNKSVHKIDLETEEEIYRIHTAVGHSWTEGILFLDNVLYIHDRKISSLIPVVWEQKGNAIYSCFEEIDYSFLLDSKNKSTDEVCKAEFRVPVPQNTAEAQFISIDFSPKPDIIQEDLFGQKLAYFKNIKMPPLGEYKLSYNASVMNASVQYTLKEVPLKMLSSIPEEIKNIYLRGDSYIILDDPYIKKMALEARLDKSGNPPGGVKSLIENIVECIISRIEYIMDDDWESADKILEKGTGWVPVDVTKIDAADINSYDYEYLFGKPRKEIPISHMGTCDDSDLGVNYYVYRHYSGGKRERTAEIKIISRKPAYELFEVFIKGP